MNNKQRQLNRKNIATQANRQSSFEHHQLPENCQLHLTCTIKHLTRPPPQAVSIIFPFPFSLLPFSFPWGLL